MLVPTLLLALAASTTPPSVVMARFVGEGMDARDQDAARARIEEELQLMGATPVVLTEPAEPACFESAECVIGLVGDNAAALRVELVRVGPLLQVSAHLYGKDGALLYESDRSVNAEGIAATGTLLGTGFAPHVRALATPEAPTPSDDAPLAAAPGGDARDGGLFVPLAIAGGVLTGIGALVLLAGGVVAIERTTTAYTPTTPGAEKAFALAVAPWAATAAVAGGVLTVVGAAVLTGAFLVE